MRGRLLKLAYGLRFHCWGSWALDRWLITLALVAGFALALWRLPGLLAPDPLAWLPVLALLALALAVVLYGRWAAEQSYLGFQAQPLAPPEGCLLLPADKVLLRATGRFEVEGKSHFFAHLLAYWRTFATREHAVMAIVHRARFLLIGTMPDRDIGMWYIFWCPEKMVELTPGVVTFGSEQRAGLRVRYDTPELTAEQRRRLPIWQRRRKFSRRETVYLSFDDGASRQVVWADLLADGDGPGP